MWSFYPLCQTLGLEGVRPHTLRHSTATLLLSLGTSVVAVQQLLGHSSPSITLNIYGHTLPGERVEAMR